MIVTVIIYLTDTKNLYISASILSKKVMIISLLSDTVLI